MEQPVGGGRPLLSLRTLIIVTAACIAAAVAYDKEGWVEAVGLLFTVALGLHALLEDERR
ncbi:hypothetical protein AB0B66_38345 [Catellatospora sp. NPDC049111]|uniref:hypothetical protein n=1 Tax=Catellatospora sp. NPDC049111 TaxID=3155271 RepID=UPI0033CDBFC1